MSKYAKTILVVEDEQTLLKALVFALEDAGFPVSTASDGETAMDKIAQKPDLVLLDIILPKKNGLEILKNMKANAETSDIPVIMLTNLSDDESISRGVELGARGYLVKADYDLDAVIKKVKEALGIMEKS